MKVLVTGANGYIGSHVVNKLSEDGFDVAAVVMNHEKKIEDGLDKSEVIRSDIFDDKIDLTSYDMVVHLAWEAGFDHWNDAHFDNVMKHYQFLKRCVDSGVKKIVVAGTMHEIGYHVGPVSSGTPCNPINPYGVAKNFLRQSLNVLSKSNNFELQWLRFYYITGNDKNSNSIFGKIYRADKDGEKTFPLNSGEMLYDFIDVNDLANDIVNNIKNFKGGIYNCCSGKPKSLRRKVEEFIQDNKLNILPEYGVFKEREYDSYAIWGEK